MLFWLRACLQFTVGSLQGPAVLMHLLCETLEVFWQVPSMQERSLFSNRQMQLKLALRGGKTSHLLKIVVIMLKISYLQGSGFPCEVCCEGFNVQSC